MKHHGIYIHIPFCRKKCDYCGFFSVPIHTFNAGVSIPDSFVARCAGEFDERLRGRDISADTIYFGGGTPSLLSVEQIGFLLESLEKHVHIASDAEITVEMNPEDVSRKKFDGYRESGVNRVVLGVQTLSERLHAIIGRSAGLCTTNVLDVYFSVRGLQHAIDLITGIHSQKEEELLMDINTVAGYKPSHISAYLLSVEKNTPLSGRLKINQDTEAAQSRLYDLTASRLSDYGYEQYEISNYSLPDCQSRHNLKYWRFEPYIGFGPGAHSFTDDERVYNAMPIADYIRSNHTVLSKDTRKPESAVVEYMLTGLRLISGLSIREMEHRLNYALPGRVMERIKEVQSKGMLIVTGEEGDIRIRLSKKGIILADSVIYHIVETLL
jgi:oxygen-independent coproporphyrinogen-3 oxidase